MSGSTKNPVLRVCHGVDIKRYNYVSVMFTDQAYEELLNQVVKTGISAAKLISIKSQPCQACQCDNVTLVIKKDGRINKQNTSQNIISKNAERHENS